MPDAKSETRWSGYEAGTAIRFCVVGMLNTAFGYGVYCLFLYLGAPYPLASFLALVAGVIWSFVTSGRFVFRSRLAGRFHKYVLVWGLLYVVNVLLISIITALGPNAYVAGLIALGPIVVMAFYLQKKYVFADLAETTARD